MKPLLQIIGQNAIVLTQIETLFHPQAAEQVCKWERGRQIVIRVVDASDEFVDNLPVGVPYDTAKLQPPMDRTAHMAETEYHIAVEGKEEKCQTGEAKQEPWGGTSSPSNETTPGHGNKKP